MEKGQIQVMGVQIHDKDGRRSWTLHGISPFEDWETGQGFKVVSEWTNRVDLSRLKYGQVVEPMYTKGYQGKAVLSNFRILDTSAK